MQPTQAETLDAQAAGHEAAARGDRPDVNPYRLANHYNLDQLPPGQDHPPGEDRDRWLALQHAWIRGYHHTRGEIEANRPQESP